MVSGLAKVASPKRCRCEMQIVTRNNADIAYSIFIAAHAIHKQYHQVMDSRYCSLATAQSLFGTLQEGPTWIKPCQGSSYELDFLAIMYE